MERKTITIRISTDIHNRLHNLSNKTGLTVSEMIRNAVTEYVYRLESEYAIRERKTKLIETMKQFEDDDLLDIYTALAKEVKRRGLL